MSDAEKGEALLRMATSGRDDREQAMAAFVRFENTRFNRLVDAIFNKAYQEAVIKIEEYGETSFSSCNERTVSNGYMTSYLDYLIKYAREQADNQRISGIVTRVDYHESGEPNHMTIDRSDHYDLRQLKFFAGVFAVLLLLLLFLIPLLAVFRILLSN
jgi:hypothetical protein